ncbi:Multidrug efflux pump subunit AcrB [Anaerovirgula multivorans]|uniref:Multidrug efflux pump subunit AcrB n=1 Tax=Anaerovirgula multivorans TaxID=312168 RepID=A0A239JKK8_9FIRM|nr:efflux RND transporter permease subunit [Anaerovirgula multivorans]SNT06329.1 Multidrug efflux pump subunit AcrB [Anaerovirgula multivorans]
MKGLIKIAVQQRRIVLFIALVTAIFGMYSYYVIPKQENPHIKVTASMVTTIYPGASPQDVEELVTKKIEDAVSEISEFKKVSSESAKYVSVVIVEYHNDADIDKANRELREKIDEVKNQLPKGCKEPEIDTNLAEAAGMLISLSGDQYSYEQLSSYGEKIEEAIGQVEGIYKTQLIGNVDKQITVKVHREQLNQLDLSLRELDEILYAQNLEIPSGSLENQEGKIYVQTKAFYQSIEDIKNTIVGVSRETGAIVRLKDIATVDMELKENVKKVKQEQQDAVIVAGYFKEDRNIIPIGAKVREVLENIKRDLPQDLVLTEVIFQPEDVQKSMGNFITNLILGMILVVVVIFIGMGFRNAVVVALSIPFTMAVTILLMRATNVTFQSVSLAGLIIALGMIVDNTIVISEGIQVRYNNGESKEEAAIEATSSAAMPVLTSTLTTLAAFVPLMFIPGDVGRFLSSLPKVVIYALSASFVSAIFVTPSILSMVIKRKENQEKEDGKIKKFFMKLLQLGLKRRGMTLMISILLLIFTVSFVMPQLKVAFFPKADKDLMYVDTFVEKIGDLGYTEGIADQISRLMAEEPEIINVTTGVGTSMPKFYITMMPLPDKENYTRSILKFDLKRSQRFTTKDDLAFYLQKKLDTQIIGAVSTLKMLEMTDTETPVGIRVLGKDMNRLKEVSWQLENALRDIPGTINVNSNASENTYEYSVEVVTDKASMLGLLNSDIQQEISTALFGSKNAVYRKSSKEYDIELKSDINSVNQLENLGIKSSVTGEKVLLKQVANIQLEPQMDSINRFKKQRSVFVTSDIKPGYSAVDVENYVENSLLKNIDLDGVQIVFEGEREKIDENFSNMGVLGILILFLIYTILLIEFKSFIEPFIILFTVPLSLIGSMLGLWIFGKPLSLTALLGVISLMGIVVNNAILLIDYIKTSLKEGYSTEEACLNAVSLRFTPIMLSSITTLIGLVPLAVSSSELFSPMAIALMNGLMLSTFLTMILIPVIYLSLENYRNQKS